MAERMGKEEQQDVVQDILTILSNAKLTEEKTLVILIELLYSIGYSLEDCPNIKSIEEIEIRYGENPTLGNALMSQAIWMRDTWVKEPERKEIKKNDRTKRNGNRRTKTTKTTTVRNLQGNGRKTRSTKI